MRIRGSRATRTMVATGVLALLATAPALAQGHGRIVGTVTDAETGDPVAGAQILVEGTGAGGVTGPRGTYSIPNVPAGDHTLTLTILGYETAREDVTVADGATARVDVALARGFLEMGQISVRGASRQPSRIVEAPAAVSVVTPEELKREGGHGQLPRLFLDEPGIDVVQSGVQDFNVNARGYNSSLNRRVLVLQDGIDRSVGFLQAQEWTALSMPLDDLGRLEMVRGPGSALYGANAFSGVINITTPSPAEIVGTKLAFSGGERGSGRFDLRHALESRNGRIGFKANVGWVGVDETFSESRTPAQAVGGPAACPAPGASCTFDYGPLPAEAVPINDDAVQSLYGSARLDVNYDDGSVLTFEGGNTLTQNEIFVTGIGRVQVNGANRPWARAQYADDDWVALAWYSGRRSSEDGEGNEQALEQIPPPLRPARAPCMPRNTCEGNSQTALASGAQLLESSDLFHVELQGNWATPDDAFRLVAGASNRWISVDTERTLMAEDQDDTITSGFGQAEWRFHPKWNALFAARVDHFSVIDETKASPKAALVFSPNRNHSIRATFNRAFQTPNYSELFLRVAAGAPVDLQPLELGIEQAIAQQIGMPVDLPLNFSPITPVAARGNDDLEVEQLTGYEVGWKGTFAEGRVFATADVYFNEIEDFITDLLPGVNPDDFPPFELGPAFDAPQLAPLRPIVEQAIRDALGPRFAAFTRFEDGTPAFVVSYTNAGEVSEAGLELGVTFAPARNWEVNLNYTFFDFDIDDNTTTAGGTVSDEELEANTPENKANLGIVYNRPGVFDAGIKVHAQDQMDWAAGVFAGRVPGFVTIDLSGSYQVTDFARLRLVWTNVLDKEHFQLFGGSILGSRAIGGLTFNF